MFFLPLLWSLILKSSQNPGFPQGCSLRVKPFVILYHFLRLFKIYVMGLNAFLRASQSEILLLASDLNIILLKMEIFLQSYSLFYNASLNWIVTILPIISVKTLILKLFLFHPSNSLNHVRFSLLNLFSTLISSEFSLPLL